MRPILAGLFLLFPSAASACAVCFGGSDANLVNGFFWGVLILLALPFLLTAGFVLALRRAARRRQTT
jgi:hypothetical protein